MKHTPNGKPRNHADEIANARAMFMDMQEIERIDRHVANRMPTDKLPHFANLRDGGNVQDDPPIWAWFVGAAALCAFFMIVAYAYGGMWGV